MFRGTNNIPWNIHTYPVRIWKILCGILFPYNVVMDLNDIMRATSLAKTFSSNLQKKFWHCMHVISKWLRISNLFISNPAYMHGEFSPIEVSHDQWTCAAKNGHVPSHTLISIPHLFLHSTQYWGKPPMAFQNRTCSLPHEYRWD